MVSALRLVGALAKGEGPKEQGSNVIMEKGEISTMEQWNETKWSRLYSLQACCCKFFTMATKTSQNFSS
jgi:hypothetical protein